MTAPQHHVGTKTEAEALRAQNASLRAMNASLRAIVEHVHGFAAATLEAATQPTFTCPACTRTSHHPDDVAAGYCGACHDYTGAPTP